MRQRKAHLKSRKGCQNCKRRHVKCDEQTPSCSACSLRKINCEYVTKAVARLDREASTSPSLTLSSSGSPRSSSSSSATRSHRSNIDNPSPLAFSSTPESRRVLEFELLHRWMTKSWLAFHSIPEDVELLQVSLPREALQHSYLMNGLLAFAAMDMACSFKKESGDTADHKKYYVAALEYQQQASADYRSQLAHINQDNFIPAYCFGQTQALFHFLMTRGRPSAIDRLVETISLSYGAFATMKDFVLNWDEKGIGAYDAIMGVAMSPEFDNVDADLRKAIDRIEDVGRLVQVPATTGYISDESGSTDGEVACCQVPTYQLATSLVRYSCVVKSNQIIHGLVRGISTAEGQDFFSKIQQRDPMALFLFMHIVVLLHDMANESPASWVGTAGRDIVMEICDCLQTSDMAHIAQVCEAIEWAKRKVAVPLIDPALLGTSLGASLGSLGVANDIPVMV